MIRLRRSLHVADSAKTSLMATYGAVCRRMSWTESRFRRVVGSSDMIGVRLRIVAPLVQLSRSLSCIIKNDERHWTICVYEDRVCDRYDQDACGLERSRIRQEEPMSEALHVPLYSTTLWKITCPSQTISPCRTGLELLRAFYAHHNIYIRSSVCLGAQLLSQVRALSISPLSASRPAIHQARS